MVDFLLFFHRLAGKDHPGNGPIIADLECERPTMNKIIGKSYCMGDSKEIFFSHQRLFKVPILPNRIGSVLSINYLSTRQYPNEFRNPDERHFGPYDFSLSLKLKVADSDQLKRFEFYAFIMGKNMGAPHVYAYVKRANG